MILFQGTYACCQAANCNFLFVNTAAQVKPNVGHSEGASGLTSVIKAVLALERGTIPPNINYSEPNPKSKRDLQNPSPVFRKTYVETQFPWKPLTYRCPWNRFLGLATEVPELASIRLVLAEPTRM